MPIRLPLLSSKSPPAPAAPASLATVSIPALLIGPDGLIKDSSPQSADLGLLWDQRVAPLEAMVETARQNGAADERVDLPAGSVFWVSAAATGGDILMMARDVTVPERMTEALMQSRALLKSLLARAADMAFDLDGDGRFRLLIPSSPFGLASKPWQGSLAESFFFSDAKLPGRNPFTAADDQLFAGVPVCLPGGMKRWLDIDIAVRRSDDGQIIGRSGVVRDVSAAREAARDARQQHIRLSIEARLTQLLNASDSVDALLSGAARALMETLQADSFMVAVLEDGQARRLHHRGTVDMDPAGAVAHLPAPGANAETEIGHWPVSDIYDGLLIAFDRPGTDGDGVLKREGFAVLARDITARPWSDAELSLVTSLAPMITSAFLRAQMMAELGRLSSLDGLTQLLNRRALGEAIDARLQSQRKADQAGILLFIDLDHFKEVNDTAGHKAGDQALKSVAGFLRSSVRGGDIAGRYGGDEFIIWLEQISLDDAQAKAQALIDYMIEMRASLYDEPLKLGASVGVCVSRPGEDTSFEALAERADTALYAAKKHGRGTVVVAD